MSAASWRLAVPPRLPRVDGGVLHLQTRHHGVPAVRVFMAAVQQNESPGCAAGWRPGLILQFNAIAGGEMMAGGFGSDHNNAVGMDRSVPGYGANAMGLSAHLQYDFTNSRIDSLYEERSRAGAGKMSGSYAV